jgi:hypothetical protein
MIPKLKLFPILIGLLILLSNQAMAQVDTSFWFVAPEVSSRHGDNPVVLRVTTFDNAANITISIPANAGFTPVYITIPANTQYSYQFPDLNQIENRPPASVLNKGILVTSDQEVSAYYEVANGNNPDKFTLKGSNALGTEFFVPSQNAFRNRKLDPADNTPPVDRERVDIVSTEDNNQITITVTDDVVGYANGSTFTITLQRGQTYCIEAIAWEQLRHLGGTHITSTKPIAVTISDDSVTGAPDGQTSPGAYDLIGDQLIPVNLLGKEYIAVNTLYGTGVTGSKQIVFVLAVEVGTHINIDGVPKVSPLNKGEMHELGITNNAIHITSTKPIYVYQLTSDSRTELGSAILPSIACTGSKKVAFTRVLASNFYVQLLTQKKNIDQFIIRDRNNTEVNELAGINWVKVGSTDTGDPENTWYTAVKEMNLTIGDPYSIENTNGLFHLSVFERNGSSMSYGYFSAYSTIRIKGPAQECKGEVVELTTQEPMKSYQWFSDKDIWTPFSTEAVAQVSESGKYWVTAEVNFGGCFTTDTLNVEMKWPAFSLGNDTILCPGESITYTIEGFTNNETFFWTPDSNATNSYSITPTHLSLNTISLTITDELGCSATDSVVVFGYDANIIDCEGLIVANAGDDMVICSDEAQLNAAHPESGIGSWSVTLGSAEFEDPNDPNTIVTNLSKGENKLRWTVDNTHYQSFDDVVITNNSPDEVNAGSDVIVYESFYALTASSPLPGLGTWSLISGRGVFDFDGDPNTVIRNLLPGDNILKWTVTNNYCARYDEVVVNYQVGTSINSTQSDELQLKLFPNPAKDVLNIAVEENTSPYSVEIHSLAGIKVLDFLLSGVENTIDVSGLEAGCYIVSVQYKDGVVLSRFFKQ